MLGNISNCTKLSLLLVKVAPWEKKNLNVCYVYQHFYIYIEEFSQKKITTMQTNVDDVIDDIIFYEKPKKSS